VSNAWPARLAITGIPNGRSSVDWGLGIHPRRTGRASYLRLKV